LRAKEPAGATWANDSWRQLLKHFIIEKICSDKMLRRCEVKRSSTRAIGAGKLCPPLSDNFKANMLRYAVTLKKAYRTAYQPPGGQARRAAGGGVSAAKTAFLPHDRIA
jgi:hypothetical protein